MANGWAKLGEALAGVSPAKQAEIEAKTINALATRDANIARTKQAIMKTRELEGLGNSFRDFGIVNPEAAANISRAGVNPRLITGAQGDLQAQEFRQAAVDAPTWDEANVQLRGVARGPVEIPKVVGGVMLGNRLVEGGGGMTVTPVGAAQIGADNARGQAALIRANKPPAPRSGGGSTAAPKLSDIDKLRLKSATAAIDVRREALLGRIATGDTKATSELDALLAEEEAIFAKFEGGGGLGSLAPPPTERGLGDLGGETWYQGPDGKQRKVGAVEPVVRPPVPPAAAALLLKDPSLKAQFAAKYGQVAADSILSKRPR